MQLNLTLAKNILDLKMRSDLMIIPYGAKKLIESWNVLAWKGPLRVI